MKCVRFEIEISDITAIGWIRWKKFINLTIHLEQCTDRKKYAMQNEQKKTFALGKWVCDSIEIGKFSCIFT